jgi:hypothetical protein
MKKIWEKLGYWVCVREVKKWGNEVKRGPTMAA